MACVAILRDAARCAAPQGEVALVSRVDVSRETRGQFEAIAEGATNGLALRSGPMDRVSKDEVKIVELRDRI